MTYLQTLEVCLRCGCRGKCFRLAYPGYDAGRALWNAMIDRRPTLIARCRGTADVIAAVNHARAHGLPVSIRGGAHNVAGHAVGDGAMMIDLSLMREVPVDPARGIAVVDSGALWEVGRAWGRGRWCEVL